MGASLKFEGIYDLRTLQCLKSLSIKHFGFDFSPKSFNFLQTNVFLKELLPEITGTDIVYLKFDHVFDPVIDFLLEAMKTNNIKKEQIVLEFNFFDKSYYSKKFAEYNFVFSYFDPYFNQLKGMSCYSVITFDLVKLKEIDSSGLLMNFVANLNHQITEHFKDDVRFEVKLHWQESLADSLIELLDIRTISFKIDSKVETSYRNVDLLKIEEEVSRILNLTS